MKRMNSPVGFLIVVSGGGCSHNPRYAGVYRIPGYPTEYPEEEDAMRDYVFSPDLKDDETNLIPSLDKALQLYRRLAQSRRRFEIIFCCEGPDSETLARLGDTEGEHLGYDVAVIVDGDYWSIVDDFCQSEWAVPFRVKLNAFGLFDRRIDAEQYVSEYAVHNEPHADFDFDIVYVIRVRTLTLRKGEGSSI